MNFDLSEEQVLLRESAARYVRDHHSLEQRRALLAASQVFSPQRWKAYAELGWLALSVSETHGGLACSMVEVTVLMEQLGRAFVVDPLASVTVAVPWVLDRGVFGKMAQHWLPAIAAGEAVVALAEAEPGRCPGAGMPNVQAVRNGASFALSGSKTLVLQGATADAFVVSARLRVDGVDELALFLVNRTCPGVEVRPYPLLDGRDCADVNFERVECAADALLLHGPEAQHVLDEALDRARIAAMAEALGGMEACMDMTAEHLRTRVQFGQPLARYQALQHMMAEIFVDVQDARSALYRALASLDAQPQERRRCVAAAQLMVGRYGRRTSASGVQLHGGYGLTDEYAISHGFRQQLVLEKLWGDAQDALVRLDTRMDGVRR